MILGDYVFSACGLLEFCYFAIGQRTVRHLGQRIRKRFSGNS
jgi:hypothetical protein